MCCQQFIFCLLLLGYWVVPAMDLYYFGTTREFHHEQHISYKNITDSIREKLEPIYKNQSYHILCRILSINYHLFTLIAHLIVLKCFDLTKKKDSSLFLNCCLELCCLKKCLKCCFFYPVIVPFIGYILSFGNNIANLIFIVNSKIEFTVIEAFDKEYNDSLDNNYHSASIMLIADGIILFLSIIYIIIAHCNYNENLDRIKKDPESYIYFLEVKMVITEYKEYKAVE